MMPAKPSIKDILNDADRAEKSGDFPRAMTLYSAILAKLPKHSKAKKALVRLRKSSGGGGGNRMTQMDANQIVGLLNQGAFEQVLDAVKMLLVHNRKEPFLYNIQGVALTQMGQNKPAIASLKHAIKLNPEFIEAYNNLGMGLLKDNRPEEALAPLQKAIAKRASYPEAHHNLGVALAALERNDGAMAAYDTAIALRPGYANAFNSRGALFSQINDAPAAIRDYGEALRLVPEDVEACQNLSAIYTDGGDFEQAVIWAAKAVALRPNDAQLLYSHAVLLNDLGQNGPAIAQLDKLLAISPNDAKGLSLRLSLGQLDGAAPLIARMRHLFAEPATDAADRVRLGFALAKMSEAAGDHEGGFTTLAKANALNFGLLDYDVAQENARFAQIKAAYTADKIAAFQEGNPSTVPILIVGLMRSGTSLVEQILASHSEVWGAGELMSATTRLDESGIGTNTPTPEQVETFAAHYLADLTLHSAGAVRITDKMPANFMHIGMLKLAFPNLKIINMVRDPRDNCYSIFKNYFDTQAHQYAYDLGYLANFANQYKSLMAHWHEVFPGQIYDCNYEALTANQEVESRKLLEYCALEWEPQVLDFHKNKRAVHTASVHQVRQKIYQTSVRSWERVEQGLAPMIEALDVDLWADYLR